MTRRRVAALAGAGVLVLSVAAAALELDRRAGLYWYDVERDYAFAPGGPQTTTIPIAIGRAGAFELPELSELLDPETLRSTVVAVRVDATLAGHWFEPTVDVVIGDRPGRRQVFERGAAGLRYVDLGDLEGVAAGAAVRLAGRHLRIEPGPAALQVTTVRAPESRRLLVVAPHPDDAEIAAFGTYAGRETWLVTVTTGSYRTDRFDRFAGSEVAREALQARLRTWDAVAGAAWAGIEPARTFSLGYPTLRLREMYEDPEDEFGAESGGWPIGPPGETGRFAAPRAESARWAALVEDMRRVLDAARPEVVITPHPVLDVASDHAFSTLALLEALGIEAGGAVPNSVPELWTYTNHNALSNYWPYGSADAWIAPPPWHDAALPLSGWISVPLEPELRVDKLFALDAMHDLRPEPRMAVGSVFERAWTDLRWAVGHAIDQGGSEHGYFRRAPRPNELFFLLEGDDLAETVRYTLRRLD